MSSIRAKAQSKGKTCFLLLYTNIGLSLTLGLHGACETHLVHAEWRVGQESPVLCSVTYVL